MELLLAILLLFLLSILLIAILKQHLNAKLKQPQQNLCTKKACTCRTCKNYKLCGLGKACQLYAKEEI